MRIALVHARHADNGGTEAYLNALARHLAERGDELAIVCRRHAAPPHPRVRFVQLHGFALGARWRAQSFARAAEAHVASASYDLVYGLGKTWAQHVWRLGGGVHATYLELAHAASRSGAKGWLTPFDGKHAFALEAERRAVEWPALRAIVVNARMVQRDLMQRYGLTAERFELISNGVDLERFHPRLRASAGAALRRELGLDTRAPVALFLGTGYGRKGLDRLIEAWPAVLRERADARLLIAGFDSTASSFAARAERLGIAASLRFLGGRADTPSCYAAADVYALPTRYDPFANTTLEALASGLPVVTTRTNGAHELMSAEREGRVLADADAAAELARALLECLEPAALPERRAAARALAEQHALGSKLAQSAALLDALVARPAAQREVPR